MSSDSDDQSLLDLLDMQRRSMGPVVGDATPLRATVRRGNGSGSKRTEQESVLGSPIRAESMTKPRAEAEGSTGKQDKQQLEVVETEQMGFRLAREIVQLREKVTKWKELHKAAELQVSKYAVEIKDLEGENRSLESAVQGCRSDLSKLHEEIRRLERKEV